MTLNHSFNKFLKNAQKKFWVIIISCVIALALWIIVRLRNEYLIDIDIPIAIGTLPQNTAIAQEIPSNITIQVNTSGWNILRLSNDIPILYIDVKNHTVDMNAVIKNYLKNYSKISVVNVEPAEITLSLEEQKRKMIPVELQKDISFKEGYDFLDMPAISPDSIEIFGAQNILDNITSWKTQPYVAQDVKNDINVTLNIVEPPSYITIPTYTINYSQKVANFTEGDAVVFIKTNDIPENITISYEPASVRVKYLIPIEQFNQAQNDILFLATSSYKDIQRLESGFIEPQISILTPQYKIKIQSIIPQQVTYFITQ